MTIGELARASGTKPVTIRYYEQIGLLLPARRSAAGYRLYTHSERDRLVFIRRCRNLGFSLDNVRDLLGHTDHPGQSCDTVGKKVESQLAQIQTRIHALQSMQTELERLRASCEGNGIVGECRIVESLSCIN